MTAETKKVLFSYWDGGTGHLTRTMSMANEAKTRGFDVGFITSEKYADWISRESSEYTTYILSNRNPGAKAPPYPFPIYSHAFGHAQRLRGLGFDDTDWLRNVTEREIEILKEFQPDLIINDYRDTIRTSAETLRIPIVGVNKSTGNPDGYTFGWWITPPDNLKIPDCRQSFNKIRKSYGLTPIEDEREMFSGNISVIPSIPEIDPLIGTSKECHYVGLLSHWWNNKSKLEPILYNIPKVFSYIGEKTRPQYGYEQMLTKVVQALPEVGFYIAGDPKKYNGAGLDKPKSQGRVIIENYIPAREVLSECTVVLSHGGAGTVLLALSYGLPIICIGPFTSEQLTFFRWVEKEHAGLIIPHSNKHLERVPAPDLGEGVEIMGHWESEITEGQISSAITKVLSDDSYRRNAKRLATSIQSLGGTKDVFDLAEKLI